MEYIRFKEVTLSTQYGYTAEETSKTDGVYKYLRITDIVPYFVDFDTVPYCSIPQKKVDQYLVQEGDVLIARTGATTGYNYVVPKGIENTIYASYLIRFIVDKSQILPLYLKYVLKGDYYYGFVNNYIGGSAQPGMNARVFGRFNIPYNTIPTQRRIASILSAYDNLIENNNRRICLLEQMAENLYKEWFVRFRFPGHEKVEMENGLPKGWKYEDLFSVATVSYGYAFKSELFCDNSSLNAVVRIRDIQDNHTDTYTSESCDEKYLIKKNAVLIGMDGIFHMCLWNGDKAYLNQRVVMLNSKYEHICNYYLFMAIHAQVKFWEQVIAGTTVAHLGDKHLRKMKVLIPNENILERANSFLESIMNERNKLFKQNQLLTRQRDLLLPRLMSGKLEVNA